VVDEVDDRLAPLRVARGRDDAGRLVEQHVGERLLGERLPVEADFVGALHEGVELPGCAVDGDAAGLDQLVGLAAGSNTRAGEPGIETHASIQPGNS